MARNLTVTIDEGLLQRARIKALRHGTSVNALIRDYLESFVDDDGQMAARQRILDLAATTTVGSAGIHWTRDELHAR